MRVVSSQQTPDIEPPPEAMPPEADSPVQPAGIQDGVWRIGLIGRNTFQNRLLKSLLEAGLEQASSIDVAETPDIANDSGRTVWDLLLWDAYQLNIEDVGVKLRIGDTFDPATQAVALFNVVPDAGIAFDRRAIEHGIRGIFYQDEPLDRFLKGVQMILQGELWFSRKTTSRILMDTHFRRANIVAAEAMLTGREKEILFAIASGAGNADIADACCISPHTVKTHLYNIYKKIGVKNRLEATLWVARYL